MTDTDDIGPLTSEEGEGGEEGEEGEVGNMTSEDLASRRLFQVPGPQRACLAIAQKASSTSSISYNRTRSRTVEAVLRTSHPGVVDIRGRRDYSRFDPRPRRPQL